jgi:hypothetical protein
MGRIMPRRSMKMFTLLECIYELDGATYEEVIDHIGNISSRSSYSEMIKFFRSGMDAGYLIKREEKYKLSEEAYYHVEAVLKLEGLYKPKDLVQAPYRNIHTPEMKLYESKLFANKRGYENGFK